MDALYLRHKDAVYATALRFLGDAAESRDVTQDTFIALFGSAARYRPTAAFTTYLRRMTVNRCINERASSRNRMRAAGEQVPDVASEGPGPEAQLQREQAGAAVRAAVAALPERQRMAVVLSRFEGLSYQEIAAALDCSVVGGVAALPRQADPRAHARGGVMMQAMRSSKEAYP